MITRKQWKNICKDIESLLGNNDIRVELNNGKYKITSVDIIKNVIKIKDHKNKLFILLKHPLSVRNYSEHQIRNRIKFVPIFNNGDLNLIKRYKKCN